MPLQTTLAESPGDLSGAAGFLSAQFPLQLRRLGALLEPVGDGLERKFAALLKRQGFDEEARATIAALTPGAAARMARGNSGLNGFLDGAGERGRILARNHVAPGLIVGALSDYERMLEAAIGKLPREEAVNLRWVREQLHFGVVLTLNRVYYEVREEEVRGLAASRMRAEEMERRRISRDLHDEAGQSLLCVRLQLEFLERAPGAAEAGMIAGLREARRLTEKTVADIRRVIADLSPAVLERLGLRTALRHLLNGLRRVHPARVVLRVAALPELPADIEIVVYRLVQECCSNVARHSRAKRVVVALSASRGRLKLTVADDGVGFRVEETGKGSLLRRGSFGLSGMRERVALLGGSMEVSSVHGGTKGRLPGTRVAVTLPWPPAGEMAKGETQ